MAKTRDMTVGSPTRLIFGFFFPLLFGLLFQQLYNAVDTVVVGRFLGVNALAGVGATGSLNFLILGFCSGICTGFVIPIAQKFGEHDYAGLKRYVVNAILIAAIFSIAAGALTALLCRTFLVWMNTPTDIINDAYAYLFVIFLGIPVTMMYNVLFGVIRSLGDSRTPVLYLVVSSLVNVVLDLAFILLFHMGVEGAAIATVISQAVATLLCVRYIRHSPMLVFEKSDWYLEPEYVKRLLAIGIPTGLQYSITAIGSIVLQTGLNGLGSHAVASVSTANKASQLIACPFDALGSTMATYGGQNVGARKLDRIRKGLRSGVIIGFLYAAIAFGAIELFSLPIMSLFVGAEETAVLTDARYFLLRNAFFYPALMLVNVIRFLIQGMGFTRQAVFAGVFEMFARGLISLFWIPAVGFTAVCFASPAAWVAADCFLAPTYFWAMRKLKKRFTAPVAETQTQTVS